MNNSFNVAICQMIVGDDKEANLRQAAEMIKEAAQKARIIVLPEIFNAPYQTNLLSDYAETIPGPSSCFLSTQAQANQVLLIGGSIPEIDAAGKIYNSSCVFDHTGNMLAKHRKLHLFDIDIPGQIVFKESDVFSAGEYLDLIDYQQLRLAVLICYDIRFPELARRATLGGAQILFVPAAFNTTTGPAHWELLMRTRAVDNQLFVVAASPARNPQSSYQAWGHSMVVDPWGNVIAEAQIGKEIVYAEINLDLVQKVRQELPVLQHRRPNLYKSFDT